MNLLSFRFIAFILTFGAIACKPCISAGQVFYGPAAEALGEAGRASPLPPEAQFMNPAGLAFVQSTTASYFYQMADSTLPSPQSTNALVVTDNGADSIVAGGIGFVNKRASYPDQINTDQDLSLDFAWRFFPTISVGIQGHRLYREVAEGSGGFSKYNLTAGFMAYPAKFLSLGLVAYNMLDDPDMILIPKLAFGAEANIENILRLRLDLSQYQKDNPNHQSTLGGGVEFNLNYGFLLRAGGLWDGNVDQNYWTGGIAWNGPRLSVAYAYKSNLSANSDDTHTFEASLSF